MHFRAYVSGFVTEHVKCSKFQTIHKYMLYIKFWQRNPLYCNTLVNLFWNEWSLKLFLKNVFITYLPLSCIWNKTCVFSTFHFKSITKTSKKARYVKVSFTKTHAGNKRCTDNSTKGKKNISVTYLTITFHQDRFFTNYISFTTPRLLNTYFLHHEIVYSSYILTLADQT